MSCVDGIAGLIEGTIDPVNGAAPKDVMFDLMLGTGWGRRVVCGMKDRCEPMDPDPLACDTKDPDGLLDLMAGKL